MLTESEKKCWTTKDVCIDAQFLKTIRETQYGPYPLRDEERNGTENILIKKLNSRYT